MAVASKAGRVKYHWSENVAYSNRRDVVLKNRVSEKVEFNIATCMRMSKCSSSRSCERLSDTRRGRFLLNGNKKDSTIRLKRNLKSIIPLSMSSETDNGGDEPIVSKDNESSAEEGIEAGGDDGGDDGGNDGKVLSNGDSDDEEEGINGEEASWAGAWKYCLSFSAAIGISLFCLLNLEGEQMSVKVLATAASVITLFVGLPNVDKALLVLIAVLWNILASKSLSIDTNSASELAETSAASSPTEEKINETVVESKEEKIAEEIPTQSEELSLQEISEEKSFLKNGVRLTQVSEEYDASENTLLSTISFDINRSNRKNPIAKASIVIPKSGWPGVHALIPGCKDKDIGDAIDFDSAETAPESGVASIELVMPTIDVIKNDSVAVEITPVVSSNGWPSNEWPEAIIKTHCAVASEKLPIFVPSFGRSGSIDINADVAKAWSLEAVHTADVEGSDTASQSLSLTADCESGPSVTYAKTFDNGHTIGATIKSPAADLELSYEGKFGLHTVNAKIDTPSKIGEITTTTQIPADGGNLSVTLSNDGDRPMNLKAKWVVDF